jgi:flagellar hook-associated protein 2
LAAQIQSSMGAGATVSVVNGKISATATTAGPSSLSLTLTPRNQGGGTLDFGTPSVSTKGRGAMAVAASVVGGQIKILQAAFGAAAGFVLSFAGGGTDSTNQLGLAAGTYRGTDVVGTIGGHAATGVGQQLVGNVGTPVDGLSLSYRGTAIGTVGDLTLTQGIGATIDRLLTAWTTDNTGSVALKESSLNATVAAQQKRLDDFNARLERRRQALLRQYLAMDVAVQKLSAQSSAFASVLPKTSSNG